MFFSLEMGSKSNRSFSKSLSRLDDAGFGFYNDLGLLLARVPKIFVLRSSLFHGQLRIWHILLLVGSLHSFVVVVP